MGFKSRAATYAPFQVFPSSCKYEDRYSLLVLHHESPSPHLLWWTLPFLGRFFSSFQAAKPLTPELDISKLVLAL